MVASVGPSYNVLSLFQKPEGSAAAADTAATDAIIETIQQLKSDTSPARLQGASAATQAWIESAPVAAASGAAVGAGGANVEEAEAVAKFESGRKITTSGDLGDLLYGISIFNIAARYVNGLEAGTSEIGPSSGFKMEENELSGEWELASESIVIDDQRRAETLEMIDSHFKKVFEEYSVRIEDAIFKMSNSIAYELTGDIAIKNDDGTYRNGIFSLSSRDGSGVYVDHNGDGFANRYSQDGSISRIKLVY